MRIRKHAKISPLLYAAASSLNPQATLIQTHVCQLNQSPWDVMTFSSSDDPETPPPPPPPLLVTQADSYMVNIGTSADCIASHQSAPPSMKFEAGDEMQKWDHDFGNGGTKMEQETDNDHGDGDGEIINLCCKSDGKGWQCKRKAKEGHSLCEHHSSSSSHQSNNKTSNSVGKKSENRPRRPRHKKTSTTNSSSNPSEYYYYSGFGPRWGKKRGAASASASATKAVVPYTSSGGSEFTSRNDVELVGVSSNSNPQSYRSNNNNNTNVSESFRFSRSSRMVDMDIEGFDYIEDDDDDDDEDEVDEDEEDDEIGQTEKKRARKPIKARSLKSLM